MSTRELAQTQARNRNPGDPIERIPFLWHDPVGYNDGPSVIWINPWSQKQEVVCALFWPTHPPEETEAIEHLWWKFGELFAMAPDVDEIIESVRKQLLEGEPDGEWYDGVTAACSQMAALCKPKSKTEPPLQTDRPSEEIEF